MSINKTNRRRISLILCCLFISVFLIEYVHLLNHSHTHECCFSHKDSNSMSDCQKECEVCKYFFTLFKIEISSISWVFENTHNEKYYVVYIECITHKIIKFYFERGPPEGFRIMLKNNK
jgi:hypothetical protein